jgi:hypothetical protein
MLNNFDDVNSYIEWRDQNTWTTRKKDLYLKMTGSSEYQQCQKEYQRELDEFNRNRVKKRAKKYVTIFAILSVVCILVSIPAYFYDLGAFSVFMQNICQWLIFPISVSLFTTFIMVDLKSKN